MNRKILVTGGAGFVGRHFVKRLLDLGDEVLVVDPLVPSTGGIHPIAWPLFVPYDYKNFHFICCDCRKYFLEHPQEEFDYVFHLAAIIGARDIRDNTPLAIAEDLDIDASYWRWAVNAKPKKTICFSSSAAYPICFQEKGNTFLLSEEMVNVQGKWVGVPDEMYGWAKLTHEFLANLAYQKHDVKSVVYRPFSGYGEDQDDSYPFPSLCKRVLQHRGENQIQVWGSGDQQRDFIHIEDCVTGVLSTMDKIDDAGALNLSTGIYTSMKQVVMIAANLCGFFPEVVGMTDKPEGSFARAGCTKKQKEYSFQYHTTFDEGVRNALIYFEKTL